MKPWEGRRAQASSKPDDLIAAALPHQDAEVSQCYVVQKPDFCFGKYMIEAIGAVLSVDQPQLPPKCLIHAWLLLVYEDTRVERHVGILTELSSR